MNFYDFSRTSETMIIEFKKLLDYEIEEANKRKKWRNNVMDWWESYRHLLETLKDTENVIEVTVTEDIKIFQLGIRNRICRRENGREYSY